MQGIIPRIEKLESAAQKKGSIKIFEIQADGKYREHLTGEIVESLDDYCRAHGRETVIIDDIDQGKAALITCD